MPRSISDWFFQHHLRCMALTGLLCTVVMLAISGHWLAIAVQTVVALVVAFIGSEIYEGETSENWLDFSWKHNAKNIVGLILIGFAWLSFIGGRGGYGVIVQTIATVFLKA